MSAINASLKSVAEQLVANCRDGKEAEGLDMLYDQNCVSVEAYAMGGEMPREAQGLEAIKAKHEWWNNAMEMHSASTHGPFFHNDNQFAVIFEADITCKDSGKRGAMKEIGVYTVENGKITREEFFYDED